MNRSLLDQLNSPLIVLLIVMVAYLLFIVARLANSEGDPSYFVYAGRTFTDPAAVPQGLRVYPLFRRDGYDGQFYYRLALNPFTTERTDFGITIDNPAYRHQRIFYPLLTWMLSLGGRPTLVPITLIAVNFFALCAIGWIGAAYMRLLKQHALWGTAFAFSPNFLYSLSLDLTEILATCLVLAGLLAIRREKHIAATACLVLAVLTKETTLLVAVGAALVWLTGAAKGQANKPFRWHTVLLPVVAVAALQLILRQIWGLFPFQAAGGNLSLPFVAFAEYFRSTVAFTASIEGLWFLALCFVILFGGLIGLCYRKSEANAHEKTCWLLYVVLAISLSRSVWVEDWAYMRALSEFFALGSIILYGSQSRLRAPVFMSTAALWLLLAFTYLRYA